MNQELPDIKMTASDTGKDFSKSILKKQFRFSDWFAEKVIKYIAFLSIAIVILIFLFVFRESAPIFKGKEKPETSTGFSGHGDRNASELKPESYMPGGDEPGSETLKPEVYVPGAEPVEEELRPETYGDIVPDIQTTEETGGEISMAEETYSSIGEAAEPVKTLFQKDWQPVSDNPRYGLLPLFIGTFKVTIIAILFAAPLAILAALYTAMFAPPRLREYIKPVVELLAGIPSVVIGFFALMVLASFFQDIFGYSSRLNAFVGGIAMGLAAIPIIYTLTEDALTAVPRTFTEASLGLGASIRQTAFSVILPAATPGIFAAVLLGIGRVFGETMIALMATGNAAIVSANPFDSVRTLSATIGAEMAEVVFGDTHYNVLFLIGSLLFIFTFTLNALAEFYFKNRVVRRIQGKL